MIQGVRTTCPPSLPPSLPPSRVHRDASSCNLPVPPSLLPPLQVILSLPEGSVTQRVQAEFLRELMGRVNKFVERDPRAF